MKVLAVVKYAEYRGDHSADIDEPIELDGARPLDDVLAETWHRFGNSYSNPVVVSFVVKPPFSSDDPEGI